MTTEKSIEITVLDEGRICKNASACLDLLHHQVFGRLVASIRGTEKASIQQS